MSEAEGPVAERGPHLQVVVFTIGGKTLGVDILQVHEILRMVEITPFPGMPAFALGAINLRGRVVPIIDLRRKLGIPERPPDAKTCIVLVRTGGHVIGFLVDEVSEVLELPASYVERPEQGPAWMDAGPFRALGKLPGRLLVILDPDRLLSAQEERLLPHEGERLEASP